METIKNAVDTVTEKISNLTTNNAQSTEGKVRWGLLGTGDIANDMVVAMKAGASDKGVFVAVGSRDLQRSQEFAKRLGIPRSYGTYEGVLTDPEVDIVYITTPHVRHKEDVLLCLNAGKPVMCEKPMTLFASEMEEIKRVAAEKKLFCMEAAWMRYIPAIKKAIELINNGTIGEVVAVVEEFGFQAFPSHKTPKERYTRLDLGGGALLDVGAYCCGLPYMIFKKMPETILGHSIMAPATDPVPDAGEYDISTSIIMAFGKAHVITTMGFRGDYANRVAINGTKGVIKIPTAWWGPESIIHTDQDGKDHEYKFPHPSSSEKIYDPIANTFGLVYEAIYAMECLRAGKLQSDIHSLDDTTHVMEIMDEVRKQTGMKYPKEKQSK